MKTIPLLTQLSCLGSVICSNSSFLNPIIPGFHPDPSCIFSEEANNTFFCASSSFSGFPGIPIHASQDLIHWRLISNALSRPEQLPDLAITNGSTSGVWAPTLRLHDGIFYITTTLVFDDEPQEDLSRWDNFILTSSNPFKSESWSNAVHFKFAGYDPSLFWDDGGAVYITGSHPWQLRPGIDQATIDLKTGEVGDAVNIWNGTGGLAPEGPHIYKKDGWYYLLIAEGGTGVNHEVTMARSMNIDGPYEANPANPVLTNANTTAYFQTVGHADLFQDSWGKWWAAALSTRSGPEYKVYPMGRETVLTPVRWHDGEWPVFTNVSGRMSGWQLPPGNVVCEGEGPLVTASEEICFAPDTVLPPQLLHWRIPNADNYVISPPGHENSLLLKGSHLNLTGVDGRSGEDITLLARRQVDTFFDFSVNMDIGCLQHEEHEAGVSVFLTQDHHFDLGVVMVESVPHFRFRGISSVPADKIVMPVNSTWLEDSTVLKFEVKAINVTHYALAAAPAEHEHWRETIGYAPAAGVSYGFTGALVGVFATTNGEEGEAVAYVSEWMYRGQGQVRS